MTIAMTGVAAQAKGILSDSQSRKELKRSLDNEWQRCSEGFDDYYEYVVLRTEKFGVPWNGVSAMWVVDNLRLNSEVNAALKQNNGELDFINRISGFMSMAFGGIEGGFPHFLGIMSLKMEKEIGIDMGLGTKGTVKDSVKKVQILVEIFESYTRNAVELIASHEK
jgi:hypothetical protein